MQLSLYANNATSNYRVLSRVKQQFTYKRFQYCLTIYMLENVNYECLNYRILQFSFYEIALGVVFYCALIWVICVIFTNNTLIAKDFLCQRYYS
jgi:hypothetical protein